MENKRQSQDLNILLKKLNIDLVPILERRYDSIEMYKQQKNMPIEVLPMTRKSPPRPISVDDGLIVSEFMPPATTTI